MRVKSTSLQWADYRITMGQLAYHYTPFGGIAIGS